MSLRSRLRGFTTWVNMRILPHDAQMDSLLTDLFVGTNLKNLVESITGKDIKRLESFDGLTEQQRVSRFEWIVADLKACAVVGESVVVDYRQCAIKCAEHIFVLLWKLVSHDALFVWERFEFLMIKDDLEAATQVSFKWTPDPPPVKKKHAVVKKSMLFGFGSAAVHEDDTEDVTTPDEDWVKYPGIEFMKSFKQRRKRWLDSDPSTKECILDIVQSLLKTTEEGRKLNPSSLGDLCNGRVLCALVNAFVPNTFTSDLLLDDRWTINTALQTAETMFYMSSKFDSVDLVVCDEMAVCSYFTSFFMLALKYRQCCAVTKRHTWLQQMVRESCHNFERLSTDMHDMRRQMQATVDAYKEDVRQIKKRHDMDYCHSWLNHVSIVQATVHKDIQHKMAAKFEILFAPRHCTVTDLCHSLHINLSICGSLGFYRAQEKEMFNDSRRLVLRHIRTGNFIGDLDNKNRDSMRKLLGLPSFGVCDVYPLKYPQYEFYFECASKNKQLKAGSGFLYQVFPSNVRSWQKTLLRACKENEMDTVGKLVTFFRHKLSFINCREARTANTPLHLACRHGNYRVVLFLLENGANIDALNSFSSSPIFSAIDGLHRNVCHLLIEWGCDVKVKNVRGMEPFDSVKNEDFRLHLFALYEMYGGFVPAVMEGDTAALQGVIHDYMMGARKLCSLSSRCINGSTLLHTAAYHGCLEAVKNLLFARVDVNLLDYKQATPLHRTRDVSIIKVLLDAGALLSLTDCDGNTALHVKCYGEADAQSEVECVEMLLSHGAEVFTKNRSGLLPVHCAAMRGRTDLIDLMLQHAGRDNLTSQLNADRSKNPLSVVHLAVVNNCIDAAQWLLDSGFTFKSGEPDILLKQILLENVTLKRKGDAVEILLISGADPEPTYRGGQTALHYASALTDSAEIVQLLLGYGADVNAVDDDGLTPLFVSARRSVPYIASVLIDSGANIRHKNFAGVTALDNILDYEEWLNTGYFSEDIQDRLKAYNLKNSRDLVRSITSRVKGHHVVTAPAVSDTTFNKTLNSMVMSRSSSRISNWSSAIPVTYQGNWTVL